MSIQSTVADIRVRRTHGATGLIAIRMRAISLQVKVVSVILLGTMLLILTAVMIGRSGTLPEIVAPPQAYLPGNLLLQLPKDAAFDAPGYPYMSFVIHLADQTIYMMYDVDSRMIIYTTIRTREYKIGDLIIAWGNPTGMYRYKTVVFVYWGTRSAVLYTHSFRPESPVDFIRYELKEPTIPEWQGFANAETKK